VGFQTNLTISAQKRIVHLIPGLEGAEIVRFGQMHRNSFICSPLLLDATMQFRQRESLFFAGQITGVEGYLGSVASGWVAGVNAARWIKGKPLWILPPTTMVGALWTILLMLSRTRFNP
jgi:methylenetetrahydrofolate--tRNA-(uracil-5-)-methyltransferase